MIANRFAQSVLLMPRSAKQAFAIGFDAMLCVFCVWVAYSLRLDNWRWMTDVMWMTAGASVVIAIPIFIIMGLYQSIFRFAGLSAFIKSVQAIAVYGVIFAAIFTLVSVPGVPRSIGILQPLLLLVAIGLTRLAARRWLGGRPRGIPGATQRARVLIYGAGAAGRQLAAALVNSSEIEVCGFLDDDVLLHGAIMGGLRIHAPNRLPELVEAANIRDVLLAMPSISRSRRNEILDRIRREKITVRTVPDLIALAQGHLTVTSLRELDIEDLLGRDPIAPNMTLLEKNTWGKVVMVTGAGGSIGSELCRQILSVGPRVLVLVERSEFALYGIHAELSKALANRDDAAPTIEVVPLLGDVCDDVRMRQVLQKYRPETLYHAAAYKHVPIVEYNPGEGLKNNVFGTMTTAIAARDLGVANFVLISTDKAVRPTNIMGASKRVGELILQGLAAAPREASHRTNYSMVRFGNVLGSSGSVVPLFRKQIQAGGPLTLTHADVTRFFMTIQEASQLVIQAGAMSEGGDVFLLDMGEPVRIYDLARRMIELSGYQVKDEANPQGDMEIVVTGLRPGEKLYEELLISAESERTAHPRILKAVEDHFGWDELAEKLRQLQEALRREDKGAILDILLELVSGFTPEVPAEATGSIRTV
ncbi:polysaccharide biosynthesis protein [Devosia sp. XGJD_8]|uniref:polysaccharide biosynthesis protein n=1 Tax=Devosia sp. XGJD_8 TaxID=3391187 RepID=UPI0039847BCC